MARKNTVPIRVDPEFKKFMDKMRIKEGLSSSQASKKLLKFLEFKLPKKEDHFFQDEIVF